MESISKKVEVFDGPLVPTMAVLVLFAVCLAFASLFEGFGDAHLVALFALGLPLCLASPMVRSAFLLCSKCFAFALAALGLRGCCFRAPVAIWELFSWRFGLCSGLSPFVQCC
ncbi:hypothetical protein U1Q18_003366 [Sarracenia purpurea var. burkii]